MWQVCAVLGSDGEIEDLVQETYLRALRSLPRFRGDAPVRLWLLSIARRTCADHVRRRQRQRRLLDRLTIEAACARRRPPIAGDISATVDLLQRLDPDRREAFALTQLAGLSYEEAAAVVGCPIGTIRSRVARARDDLRAAFGDRRDRRLTRRVRAGRTRTARMLQRGVVRCRQLNLDGRASTSCPAG